MNYIVAIVVLAAVIYPLTMFGWAYMVNLHGKRRGELALAAMNEDCDARDELLDWFADHPDESIYASRAGREIFWRCVKAYEGFRNTHPFIKKDNFPDHLRSLVE